jgi:hypothetical protein
MGKAYISERYPQLSVGGLLRFNGGFYRAKNEKEEGFIEGLPGFKAGQIRVADDGEKPKVKGARVRAGMRGSLQMKGGD